MKYLKIGILFLLAVMMGSFVTIRRHFQGKPPIDD